MHDVFWGLTAVLLITIAVPIVLSPVVLVADVVKAVWGSWLDGVAVVREGWHEFADQRPRLKRWLAVWPHWLLWIAGGLLLVAHLLGAF
jgi:hypothetical protein